MAALSTQAMTLLDHAKSLDPDGKVAAIVELLSMTNEILLDARWVEGNLTTGHRTTIRTGLPAVYWRMLNTGVPPSKSTKAQITEACGMLEAWSETDVRLAQLGGNLGALRLSEAMAFLEAMNQEMASTLFYGNQTVSPAEFTGLAARYSSLTGSANSQNVIDAQGSTSGPPTDLTSVYLVAWGEQTVHGLFPKGSKAGLTHNDFGEQTVEVTNGIAGSRMRAFQDQYVWDAGLCVKDWRYAARVCNIDVSDLKADTAGALLDYLEEAIVKIPNQLGSKVFYMNRTLGWQLRRLARKVVGAGGGLTFENYGGKGDVLMYSGVPIRICDAILNTESEVA